MKTQSKHTPGPWRLEQIQKCFIPAMKKHGYTEPSELEANARLIAAAPELLEACKEVVAWMEIHYPQLLKNGWQELQAAIAKAEVKP